MDDYNAYLNQNIFKGKTVNAEYKEQALIDYMGNPFIEALPPILSPNEAKIKIRFSPYFNKEERELPTHIKIHCVERIKDLVEPLTDHIDIEQRFSRMIRHGYTATFRNPMTPEYIKMLNSGSEAILNRDLKYFVEYGQDRSTASGFVIIGMSGIGKTTAIERVLLQYPQVIVHSNYKGRNLYTNQIVWLKLDCPFDGGTKGLCLKFFHSIDMLLKTNYYKKFGRGKTTEQMLPEMAQVSTIHGLGVLVIDEIQNLNLSRSGGHQKMLNFFVELVNCIGIPVVLVGTREAIVPVTEKFSNARRNTGEDDKEWGPMSNDNEWYTLMSALWKYQWTKKETDLTPELSNLLYEESCGITDIAIKLYILSQWRAITTGREIIDMKVIKSVAKDSLKLLRPALDLIKQGNLKELETKYPDVLISKVKMDEFKNIYIRKMAEQGKSKASKGAKQQKIEEEEQIMISEISSWLVQAGIDCEKSIECSKEVIEKLGLNTDISTLRKEVFSIAFKTSSIEESINTRNSLKKEDNVKTPGELVETLNSAISTNKDVNDLLKEKGIIKNPNEFI